MDEEIVFAAVSRGLSRQDALTRAADALLKVGITEPGFLERRCWWLSGGERRIVEAVAALIAPASLLALDEPTAGLDPAARIGMAALVRERSERGPVLVASQDLAFVGALDAEVVTLTVVPSLRVRVKVRSGAVPVSALTVPRYSP